MELTQLNTNFVQFATENGVLEINGIPYAISSAWFNLYEDYDNPDDPIQDVYDLTIELMDHTGKDYKVWYGFVDIPNDCLLNVDIINEHYDFIYSFLQENPEPDLELEEII